MLKQINKNFKLQGVGLPTPKPPKLELPKIKSTETSNRYSTDLFDANLANNFKEGLKITGGILDAIPNKDPMNSADATSQALRNNINKAAINSGNPIAMVAGVANSIIDKTGGYSNASKGLGGFNDFGNSIASTMIPGLGYFLPKTKKFKADETVKQSSGFSGLNKEGNLVSQNANSKLLFGSNKQDRLNDDITFKNKKASNMLLDNKLRFEAIGQNSQDLQNAQNIRKLGGINIAQVGKKGLIISYLNDAKKILRSGGSVNPINEDGIIEHSSIPGGKLHAHKHAIKDYDENISNQITSKGVPVVTFEEGGLVKQHVEIERGELSLRSEILLKLLELKEINDEESLIEAGKIFTDEIINNTKDFSEEYDIND